MFNDWIFESLFCQILEAAFHTTSPHYSFIYVLYCPPFLLSSPIPSPTHHQRQLLCLLPQGHVTSCDRRHQYGLTTLLLPQGKTCRLDTLQKINMLDVTKTVFKRRWSWCCHIPQTAQAELGSSEGPKAITKWIISHSFWCGRDFSAGNSSSP